MASLKEMRNRIASVKATRKITKAMQMVAAAKLRRAQEAAQAARPYAERMATVLGSIASKVADKAARRRLLVGTGKDQVHLLIVMTAERGLCGGFNSNIAKLARADAQRLIASGKTVKIMTVGRKGADNLRRDLGKNIVERKDFQGVKQIELRPCRRRRAESARDVRSRRVRRRNALLLGIQVGDFAKADGAAAHSGERRERKRRRREGRERHPRIRAERGRGAWASCCRATSRRRFSADFSKTRLPSRARACRRWTTPRAMPAT